MSDKKRITVYLPEEQIKLLKYISVDFDKSMSNIIEHALGLYIYNMKERGPEDLYKQWIKQEKNV